MASPAAQKRLTREFLLIKQEPPPFIQAKPLEENILVWHYVISGPPETPYHGGEYWGKLIFPSEYPFKPPSIWMTTPSGRFKVDTRLCLTMSDFHRTHFLKSTLTLELATLWNPSWSVSTILNGLLSFMVTAENTTGSIRTTDTEKRQYATESRAWNRKRKTFREIFPELITAQDLEAERQDILRNLEHQQQQQQQLLHQRKNQNVIHHAFVAGGGGGGKGAAAALGGETNSLATMHSRIPGWVKWATFGALCIYLLISRFAARAGW